MRVAVVGLRVAITRESQQEECLKPDIGGHRVRASPRACERASDGLFRWGA